MKVGMTFGELMAMEFPPIKVFLSPWLQDQTITLLVGPKGGGKTWVAMGIAQAVASGSKFGRWTTVNKTKVLYVEAEMPARIISDRFKQIDGSAEFEAVGGAIHVVSCDDFENRTIPNLSDPEYHEYWAKLMEPYEVIVLDNLLNCARRMSGRDDDDSVWRRVASFLKPLRAKGKAIVLLHHTGKSGAQLGTSIKENDVDTIIMLTPEKERRMEGFGCDVRFDKARSLEYPANAPFYLDYGLNEAGKYAWTETGNIERRNRKIWDLKAMGMSERDIADTLGIHFVTVKLSLRGIDKC